MSPGTGSEVSKPHYSQCVLHLPAPYLLSALSLFALCCGSRCELTASCSGFHTCALLPPCCTDSDPLDCKSKLTVSCTSCLLYDVLSQNKTNTHDI